MADAGGFVTDIVAGKIEIDVSQMRQTRDIVVRAAQEMDKAMQTFGVSTDQGAHRAVSAISTIKTALNEAGSGAAKLSLAVAGFGVASARSVSRTVDQFKILVGNEQKAQQLMDQIRQSADDTHQAFLPLLEGATSLVPIMRQGNAEFGDMLTLVQQLAGADPVQGAQGATYALREFFSGSYRSLAQRFELSSARLQEISKQHEGDMQGAVKALQDYMDELGYSSDALAEFGAQGHNAFTILRSEAQETASVFFAPFNDGLNQAAMGISDFLGELRDIDPMLIKIIGTMTTLVGLTQAASLANMIPGAGAIPGLGKATGMIGKAATVGAVGYGGAQAGIFATRALADAGVGGGFERFQGKSQQEVQDELMKSIKALSGILIIGGVEAAKVLVDIVYALEDPFNWLVDKITDVIDFIDEVTPSSKDVAKDVGMNILSVLPGFGGIAGALKVADRAASGQATTEQESTVDAQGRPIPGMGQSTMDAYGALEQLNNAFAQAQGLYAEGKISLDDLSAVYSVINPKVEALSAALGVETGTREDALGVIGESTEETKSSADQAKDSLDEFATGLLKSLGIIDEKIPVIEQFNQGLGGIGAGVESMIAGVLGAIPEDPNKVTFNQEQIDAFGAFQEDMASIESDCEARRLEQAQQHAEQLLDIQKASALRMTQMQADENRRRERMQTQLEHNIEGVRSSEADKLADLERENEKKRREIQKGYNEAEKRARRDLNRELLDLQEAYKNQLLRASMRLDAVAIWEAQQNYSQQKEDLIDSADEEAKERKAQYKEQLADQHEAYEERRAQTIEDSQRQIEDMRRSFADQERIRAEDYALQMQRMQEAHQRELANLDSKNAQALQKLNTAEAAELASREQAFRDQLIKLDTHNANMLAIQQGGLGDMESGLKAWYEKQKAYFGTMVNTPAGVVISGRNPGGNTAYGAAGGPVRSGMMYAQQGEYLLNQQTTRSIQSMLGNRFTQPGLINALAGSGGGGNATTIESIQVFYPEGSQQWSERKLGQFFDERLTAVLQGAG
jgi:hypothetical protein